MPRGCPRELPAAAVSSSTVLSSGRFDAASAAAAGAVAAPMTSADLDEVMALETSVYPFPWTRGNFVDSLAAGYYAEVLRKLADGQLQGYIVALSGVDEMHLLNVTVAPQARRQGHARALISALLAHCAVRKARCLWLEVRQSNAGARLAYARLGFAERGERPGYYPAARGHRENAVLMSREIAAAREPDIEAGREPGH